MEYFPGVIFLQLPVLTLQCTMFWQIDNNRGTETFNKTAKHLSQTNENYTPSYPEDRAFKVIIKEKKCVRQ